MFRLENIYTASIVLKKMWFNFPASNILYCLQFFKTTLSNHHYIQREILYIPIKPNLLCSSFSALQKLRSIIEMPTNLYTLQRNS